MYTIQSLWTMAREKLNVTTVVFNNASYSVLNVELERVGAEKIGDKARAQLDLSKPVLNFTQIAEGLGVAAVRATDPEAFTRALERALASRGPHLIEAVVPPTLAGVKLKLLPHLLGSLDKMPQPWRTCSSARSLRPGGGRYGKHDQSDVVIAGGGLAGIVTALECLRAGKSVTLVDRDTPERRGLALWAFGGMALVGTPLQAHEDPGHAGDRACGLVPFRGGRRGRSLAARLGAIMSRIRVEVYDWLLGEGLEIYAGGQLGRARPAGRRQQPAALSHRLGHVAAHDAHSDSPRCARRMRAAG